METDTWIGVSPTDFQSAQRLEHNRASSSLLSNNNCCEGRGGRERQERIAKTTSQYQKNRIHLRPIHHHHPHTPPSTPRSPCTARLSNKKLLASSPTSFLQGRRAAIYITDPSPPLPVPMKERKKETERTKQWRKTYPRLCPSSDSTCPSSPLPRTSRRSARCPCLAPCTSGCSSPASWPSSSARRPATLPAHISGAYRRRRCCRLFPVCALSYCVADDACNLRSFLYMLSLFFFSLRPFFLTLSFSGSSPLLHAFDDRRTPLDWDGVQPSLVRQPVCQGLGGRVVGSSVRVGEIGRSQARGLVGGQPGCILQCAVPSYAVPRCAAVCCAVLLCSTCYCI